MRYFGSKFSTLEQLGALIRPRAPSGTFCDAFGGVGTVGSYFKSLGYQVWSGDVLTFAHCFQVAKVKLRRLPAFKELRNAYRISCTDDLMRALRGKRSDRSWFVQNYAVERKFFTLGNAQEIERIWKTINKWNAAGLLTSDEHAVLVASLIQSMDQVANTAGTYYAYLKSWHRKANQAFSMNLVRPSPGPFGGVCHLGSAQDLVASRRFNILYLDPPYNERSYPHYYHLPETLARGERPKIHGVSGIPNIGPERSPFNDPKKAAGALTSLVEVARFKWLAFHYADDGLITPEEVRRILRQHGRVEEFKLTSKGYTTKTSKRTVAHRLYLLKHA